MGINFKKYLHQTLAESYPELLISLKQHGMLNDYLTIKTSHVEKISGHLKPVKTPKYILEEICLSILAEDLPRSKFEYLSSILEEEFEETFYRFKRAGILTYELINLLEVCKADFALFGFSYDNATDTRLKYTVMGNIVEYLDPTNKSRRYGL